MTSIEQLADEFIETDILIIGGGLAGKMAAIRAKEKGNADVVIVEKANISRCGEAPNGLDDYPAVAHPKINGITPEAYGRTRAADLPGLVRTDLSIITARYAIQPIAVLEQIGVRVQEDDGTYWMAAGRLGGALQTRVYNEKEKRYERVPGDFIKYRGADLNPKLAAAVLKRGVRVYNRTMLTRLLTKDGSVVGATAVNTRDGKFYVFKAKFVFMGTGPAARLNDSLSPYIKYPNNLFYQYHCPANSGGGHMAAYKAGADLVNMEFIQVACSNLGKYMGMNGGHLAPLKNSKGENLHKKYDVNRLEGKTGGIQGGMVEFAPDLANPGIERDVLKTCWEGIVSNSPETMGAFNSSNEAPANLGPTIEKGGIRAFNIEVMPSVKSFVRSMSGIMFDKNGETSVKGLYVAGDVVGALPLYGSAGAFAWGYKIGDYLRELAPETGEAKFDKEQVKQVEAEKKRVFAPMNINAKEGLDPLQVENLARKLVTNYVGIHRIEPRMKRCVEHLQEIKENVIPLVRARDYHELMRAIELQEIVDLAEIHARSSIIRNETRMGPGHHRLDYPETDERNWNGKVIVVNQGDDGEAKFAIKELEKGA